MLLPTGAGAGSMPWPIPNKGVCSIVVLATLIARTGRCDTPGSDDLPSVGTQSAASAPDRQPDFDPGSELPASTWTDRFQNAPLSSSVLEPAATSLSFSYVNAESFRPDAPNVTSPATPGHAEPDSDKAEPQGRDDQLLFLDMTVNGTRRGSVLMMVDAQGKLYAQSETLAQWGMRAPYPESVEHFGREFHAFGSMPGVKTQVTTSTMSGSAQIPPEYLVATTRSLSWGASLAPTSDTGAFLDYSVAYTDDPGLESRQLTGLLNPTVFTAQGNLSAGLLYRTLDTPLDSLSSEFLRLDTTWTRDFPDKVSSLRLGDSLTPGSSWSRSLRFGGIQWATNFATQPSMITFPQPSIGGSAAVPTALDIFVNGALRSSQQVPDGTFRIDDVPVVTGAGQIEVVTRDLMGREQLIVQDFYTSRELLRPGLSDYSFSLGALRENYGTVSDDYSQTLASAIFRRGMTSNLTLEGRFDGTADVQVAGGSAAYSVTHLGVFSAAMAVSNSAGTGALWQLGHEYQGRKYRFDVRFLGTSEQFRQPGLDLPGGIPKLQSLVSVGTGLGVYGSLGMSYIDEQFYDPTLDRKVVNVSYSTTLPYELSLSVAGSYIQQVESDVQASVMIMKYFGGRRSASATMQRATDFNNLRMEYRDDAPPGPGYGYRAAVYSGDARSLEAATTVNTRYSSFLGEIKSRDGKTGVRAQMDGSVAWLDGGFYASREIRDGFAVVDAGGFEGVRVYLENREMGVTDAEGRMMVPGLRPYQVNRIRIESRDLPLTARVSQTSESVAPYFKSGSLVTFDVEDTRGALLRVVWPNGTPAPRSTLWDAMDGCICRACQVKPISKSATWAGNAI
jgi:outer membrane usher protein